MNNVTDDIAADINIRNNTLEYSIIRRYTNAVY